MDDTSDEPSKAPRSVRKRLNVMRAEHRTLDETIIRLTEELNTDQLQIQRLKKRKLLLKDMIAQLESQLIPDLDA